ncbi:hypothetical protein BD410DRAFT_824510 [Rickenella mellea]|uniref:DUF7704 domain-containing protein n=1 Tax=Rickenella mellea TaxID=50990 RepID=A0A4Y7QPP9_9AGAM|nr:hypothetical protein BD410DRAFT_824510 [Rickenella mellea]
MAKDFPALPGFYNLLFLHLEPVSTVLPALVVWFYPGAAWFHHQLVPSEIPTPLTGTLEPRAEMAIWQLGSCFFLLGLLSSLVFRAVRDAIPNDPIVQERILGASFTALAIADVIHIAVTIIGLPYDLRYDPLKWNSLTHGNITAVIVLLSVRGKSQPFFIRLAWFAGIGRETYYYGVKATEGKGNKKA